MIAWHIPNRPSVNTKSTLAEQDAKTMQVALDPNHDLHLSEGLRISWEDSEVGEVKPRGSFGILSSFAGVDMMSVVSHSPKILLDRSLAWDQ